MSCDWKILIFPIKPQRKGSDIRVAEEGSHHNGHQYKNMNQGRIEEQWSISVLEENPGRSGVMIDEKRLNHSVSKNFYGRIVSYWLLGEVGHYY